jgi:hypothetical protein
MLHAKQRGIPNPLEQAVFDLQNKLWVASRSEGRPATIDALLAVTEFLSVISGPGERLHQRPFNELISALRSLNDGAVLPLLEPVRRSGRPRNSAAMDYAKALAVFITRRLCDSGMNSNDAYGRVALVCRQAGLRPSRRSGGQKLEMTARTVREWCAAISADVGCRTRVGQNFASLMSPCPRGPVAPDELLAKLGSFLADTNPK